MHLLDLCDNMLFEIMKKLSPNILGFARINKRIYWVFKAQIKLLDCLHYIEVFTHLGNDIIVNFRNKFYPKKGLTFVASKYIHVFGHEYCKRETDLNNVIETIFEYGHFQICIVNYDENNKAIMPIYRIYYSNENNFIESLKTDHGIRGVLNNVYSPSCSFVKTKFEGVQASNGDKLGVWIYQKQEYIWALARLVDYGKLPEWFGPRLEKIIVALDKVFGMPEIA